MARLSNRAPAWVGPLARIGYATKGTVYLLVGVLAVLAATTKGGEVTDGTGAIRTAGRLSIGTKLLWPVAVGLVAYAGWRFVQAWYRRSSNPGLGANVVRVGLALSGVLHLLLAASLVDLALGAQRKEGFGQTMIARLLIEPAGHVVLFMVGIGLVGYAVFQLVAGVKGRLPEDLREAKMSPARRRIVDASGRIGLLARGIVFGIVGSSLVKAARQAGDAVTSSDGALRQLVKFPFGHVMLAIVAAGLAAYGISMLVAATCKNVGHRA